MIFSCPDMGDLILYHTVILCICANIIYFLSSKFKLVCLGLSMFKLYLNVAFV